LEEGGKAGEPVKWSRQLFFALLARVVVSCSDIRLAFHDTVKAATTRRLFLSFLLSLRYEYVAGEEGHY